MPQRRATTSWPWSAPSTRTIGRRPVRQTLEQLAGHDDRIAEYLRRDRRPDRGPASTTRPRGRAHAQATALSRSDGLPPVAVDALVSVHQHRALTARQLQALRAPTSTLRWTQKITARLAAHGLLDSVRVDRGRQLFFVTAAGADAVGPDRVARRDAADGDAP